MWGYTGPVADLGGIPGVRANPPLNPFISINYLYYNCHALIRKIGGWYGLCNHNYISRGCPRPALAQWLCKPAASLAAGLHNHYAIEALR